MSCLKSLSEWIIYTFAPKIELPYLERNIQTEKLTAPHKQLSSPKLVKSEADDDMIAKTRMMTPFVLQLIRYDMI